MRVLDTLYSLSLETDWETTHLGHQVELEWRLKVFPITYDLQFWISPHQGTHSCSQILKLTKYMLSFSNKVDPFNSPLHTSHAYFQHAYGCVIMLSAFGSRALSSASHEQEILEASMSWCPSSYLKRPQILLLCFPWSPGVFGLDGTKLGRSNKFGI